MSRNTRHLGAAAVALALVGAAGCAVDGSKAGGAAPVLTLRIGTDDSPDRPAAHQIEEFARQVEELSDGALDVEPVWEAVPDGPVWDQRVARQVREGQLDMGLIPSRAWDTEGVTTFRALNAPFLVTSDDLLAEVVTADLAEDMLAGLDGSGVVGMALFPEGLRHPFGFSRPLLGPGDYAGQAIRAPRSDTTEALFAALGASATDAEPDPETQVGMESSYFLGPEGVATGNVAFFPKVNVLVVNEERLTELSADQRSALEEAAERARDRSMEELPHDAEAAKLFCDGGGTVVLAEEADVAALREATAPVYADLEQDPATAAFIRAIRGLPSASLPGTPGVGACGATADGSSQDGVPPDPAALEGVYRFEVSEQELRDAGVRDAAGIRENAGLFTWTLDDGTWCFEQQGRVPVDNPDDCGPYEVDGDRLTINIPDGPAVTFRWAIEDDGALAVTPAGAMDAVFVAWGGEPWTRIGDVG